jgi:NAD(P)-dependent dehydrogenase (short-subunit alcohol dehydrogenase family)
MAKTILITGTSSGIGRATALYFAERGWNVVATMRDPSKADPVLHHPRISLLALDVTDADSIAQAIADALTHYQKIDVLLNNALRAAGIRGRADYFGTYEHLSDEPWMVGGSRFVHG